MGAAALHLQITAETHLDRGPEIVGRFTEMLPVTAEGGAIELLEPLSLGRTATGGFVMEGPTEHPRAEVVPVSITEQQMQVPHLVNLIRWRHLVISHHRQKDKLTVFLNGTHGEVVTPAIAAHQMIIESDRMTRVV